MKLAIIEARIKKKGKKKTLKTVIKNIIFFDPLKLFKIILTSSSIRSKIYINIIY